MAAFKPRAVSLPPQPVVLALCPSARRNQRRTLVDFKDWTYCFRSIRLELSYFVENYTVILKSFSSSGKEPHHGLSSIIR